MERSKIINFILICTICAGLLYVFKVNVIYCLIPLLILITGLVYKPFALCILFIWEKIGHVIGFINSKIILFIVYFFILTSYSLLYKWKGKSNYQNKFSVNSTSMFVSRKYEFEKSDFEKSW